MREGVKTASAQVVHAGEKVGAVWSKTLDSAMWVCAACGALAILLIALSLAMRTWRHQRLSYTDDNGENISRVELGLRSLQRIQTLHRKDDAGVIVVYDPPLLYQDAMDSAYCLPDAEENGTDDEGPQRQAAAQNPDGSSSNAGEDRGTSAASGEPEAAGEEPEDEAVLSGQVEPTPQQQQQMLEQQQREEHVEETIRRAAAADAGVSGVSFLSRQLQQVFSPSRHAERRGPLARPPPYSVTLGRDPGAPGSLTGKYAEMRGDLLGPTLFDVHCKDLEMFKKSGALFGRMAVAYIVFAGLGMAAAAASLLLTTLGSPWAQRVQDLPVNLVGTVAWLVALVLQLCGLASWGVGTDVAACVTDAGGAGVCALGSAAAIAIGSLVLTLVATLSYCLFFTHKFIRDLGIDKQRQEDKEKEIQQQLAAQQAYIQATHYDEQDGPQITVLPSQTNNNGGPHSKASLAGSVAAVPRGAPHSNSMGAPLSNSQLGPQPVAPGESETPARSVTGGSQAVKH
ncbi:uncharacterized protein EMH_0091790 [Eimeria mitis]|uniref:Uncharacterized protein n=1 Tax=Eimeria mitis TaxID=44415 RepID=U6JUG7_9EIME|nr:uncharacterized protein EMH_0091790 [Eimeria mitis]CDJ27712.1 hypothetical protein, conserved [Eimeria mitis]